MHMSFDVKQYLVKAKGGLSERARVRRRYVPLCSTLDAAKSGSGSPEIDLDLDLDLYIYTYIYIYIYTYVYIYIYILI